MPVRIPRCQIIPEPDHRVSFVIDGQQRLGWHFGTNYPRPFFYPLIGPAGTCLTRMGHPGAPNHDHHQSIWFAHHKVLGIDFWANNLPSRIRQKEWLAYHDGEVESIMAVKLGWYDGHDPKELLEQELIVAVRPGGPVGSDFASETLIELQSTFRPTGEMLEFGKTNFGFLAVRVARNLSVHFGGGTLTDSEDRVGEPAIFGNRARWMDYSGPVSEDHVDGITYFDHPTNPGSPTHWHVREDGWMGASACFSKPLMTTRQQPLVLRYQLHAHAGKINAERASLLADQFADKPCFEVAKATVKHETWTVKRVVSAQQKVP